MHVNGPFIFHVVGGRKIDLEINFFPFENASIEYVYPRNIDGNSRIMEISTMAWIFHGSL